jgi:hypothetical protein
MQTVPLTARTDSETPVLYMVIERLKDAPAVYRRLRDEGRELPEGLRYVASWVEPSYARCWQVMETDDPRLFDAWIAHWQDLAEFEVVPVLTSAEATEVMRARL